MKSLVLTLLIVLMATEPALALGEGESLICGLTISPGKPTDVVKQIIDHIGYDYSLREVEASFGSLKFKKDGQIDGKRLEARLVSLYQDTHPMGRVERIRYRFSAYRQAKYKIQQKLLTRDILTAMTELNLVDGKRLPTRMGFIRSVRMMIVLAMNIPYLYYFKIPFNVPMVEFKDSFDPKNLPESVIEKIRKEGFDAAYPEIKALFSKKEKFEVYWNAARTIYFTLASAYVLSITALHPHIYMLPIEAARSSPTTLQAASDKMPDQKLRDEIFNSWKTAFVEMEHRQPDPAKDKQEWEDNWKDAYNTPIEELRVQFLSDGKLTLK